MTWQQWRVIFIVIVGVLSYVFRLELIEILGLSALAVIAANVVKIKSEDRARKLTAQ